MHPLVLIAVVAVAGILITAMWAGWGAEGRKVLPAECQSRPVERA